MAHKTYYNANNIEVPSVTTILKILNKPLLVKWANGLGFKKKKVDDVLEASAHIGTILHFIIECDMQDMAPIYLTNKNNVSHIETLYEKYLYWKRKHKIEPILLEKELCSKNFGGTFDFYGNYDNKLTLLDFKTSESIYMSMFIQLSGYILLLEENNYQVDQCGIVAVTDRGVNTKIISREDMQKYIDLFKALVYCYHLYNDISHKDMWGEKL